MQHKMNLMCPNDKKSGIKSQQKYCTPQQNISTTKQRQTERKHGKNKKHERTTYGLEFLTCCNHKILQGV